MGVVPEEVTAEFCWNSRRWVTWMFTLLKSCPQKGNQGNTLCKGPECAYYEMKPVTRYYREKLFLLTGKTPEEFEEDAQSGQEDDDPE